MEELQPQAWCLLPLALGWIEVLGRCCIDGFGRQKRTGKSRTSFGILLAHRHRRVRKTCNGCSSIQGSFVLLGRYLQQLIMESLGKKYNLAGDAVHLGLTVYGNKGSTDQHAYIHNSARGRMIFCYLCRHLRTKWPFNGSGGRCDQW